MTMRGSSPRGRLCVVLVSVCTSKFEGGFLDFFLDFLDFAFGGCVCVGAGKGCCAFISENDTKKSYLSINLLKYVFT